MPENSLAAFKRALNHFQYLELDLRLLADETLVVFHDKTLGRMTSAPPDLASTPMHWLEADAVRAQTLKGSQSERPPLFSEVLDLLIDHPGALLFAELKDHHPFVFRPLLKVLEGHPVRDRVTIQSFDHRQLHKLVGHGLQLCPLYWFRPKTVDALPCAWEAPMAEALLLRPSMIRDIHQAGRKVAPWFLAGERIKPIRRRLEKLNIDALMVDYF